VESRGGKLENVSLQQLHGSWRGDYKKVGVSDACVLGGLGLRGGDGVRVTEGLLLIKTLSESALGLL